MIIEMEFCIAAYLDGLQAKVTRCGSYSPLRGELHALFGRTVAAVPQGDNVAEGATIADA